MSIKFFYLGFVEQGRPVAVVGPVATREEINQLTPRAFELYGQECETAEFLTWQVFEIDEDKATIKGLLNEKLGLKT